MNNNSDHSSNMNATAETPRNNTETLPEFVSTKINEGARVTYILMGIPMVLSGFIGNCLLLLVIFKQSKRGRSHHMLFVANLSLADLLTMGYWFTFFVLDLILNRHPVVNYAHCTFNGILVSTMYLASISFLVNISLNRYLHVCHSHLYSRVFTLPRTVAWCLLTWLASLLIALSPTMDNRESTNFRYNPVTRFCSYNRNGVTYMKVIALIYAILPMLFVAYCNFAIFRCWRRARLGTSRRYPLVKREERKRERGKPRKKGERREDGKERREGKQTEVETGGEGEEPREEGKRQSLIARLRAARTKDDEERAEGRSSPPTIEDRAEPSTAEVLQPKDHEITEHNAGSDTAESTLSHDKGEQDAKTPEEEAEIKRDERDVTHAKAGDQSPAKKKGVEGSKAREVALVRSLFVVFLLAVVTFIPYGAMTVLGTHLRLSPEVIIFGNFFLFFNNSINWVVYGVMNTNFRRDYLHYSRKMFTICCSCRRACKEDRDSDVSLARFATPFAQRSNTTNTSEMSPRQPLQLPPVCEGDETKPAVIVQD